MLFSSTVFLYLFLPVVLFFYYVVFRKNRLLQNVFLLLASLFFYAWGEPKFVVIMIASIVVNWAFGLLVNKYREKKKACVFFITLDTVFNLSVLFVFKYLMFTGNIINSVFHTDFTIPNIVLPIGISFFTFQAMSYVIDVYRQKGEVQTNLLYVGLYISFFPQLIAGPIVRYETIANEIKDRKETLNDFANGLCRFIIGLSKKVLLANNFAILADSVFNTAKTGSGISVALSWLGVLAYTLQIFFDFSGYSDMAIGLGKMFGFHFLENFNYPYISTSVSEFWRRWHISLGTWFKDYVYIPLGGSRVKKSRNIFNLFVVWLLTGLWHGANFTFILWGMMFFVLLTAEKLSGFEKKGGKALKCFKWVYTMFFVMIGWVFFRADSVQDAFYYLKSMFGVYGNSLTNAAFWDNFSQNIILVVIGIVLCTPVIKLVGKKISNWKPASYFKTMGLVLLLILCVANLVSSSYNPFIYFNF